MIHYQFETIHPFVKGNGRIGRMMVPLYLQSKGILSKPCLYISDYLEKNKETYFSTLMKVRNNSDMISWLKFFMQVIIETAKTEIEKLENVSKLDLSLNNFIETLSVKTTSTKKFLETIYENPVLDRDKLSEYTGVKEGTTRNIISSFLEKEIISIIKTPEKLKILTFENYFDIFFDK